MSAVVDPAGASLWSRAEPLQRGSHLLCMTLFNEPLAELWRSAGSVAAALQHAPLVRPLALAWVVDGVDHADVDVLAWLQGLGFAIDAAHTDTWQHCVVPLGALSGAGASKGPSVSVWLHLKARNRGKLDSHAVFFETLCRPLQPDIVFQLDVGTTVGEQSFVRALAHFDRAPDVAALSSRCAAQAPAASDGFLRAWQFFDTASQLVTVWPTEQLCGHLSVIPGQFCALRWRALIQPSRAGVTPLQRYLRGLSATSQFERTMFLAEDRVIGQALMLAPEARWTVAYAEDVPATNDACETLDELMRQRRRWHNGANACRLALLARWLPQLCRPDHSAATKLHFSTGVTWQAVQLLQQMVDPATWLLSQWLLAMAMTVAWQGGHGHAVVLAVCAQGLGLLATALGHRRLAEAAWWCATLACAAVLWLAGATPGTLALLYVPQWLTLVLLAWRYPAEARTVLRRGAEHLWCDGPLRLWLSGYALLRLGDVSWGTKGLNNTVARRGWHDPACWVMPVWVLVNLLAVGLAVASGKAAQSQASDGELIVPMLLWLTRWVSLLCVAGGCGHLLWELGRRLAHARQVSLARAEWRGEPR